MLLIILQMDFLAVCQLMAGNMTDILTKKQNYALWQSGAFGNKLRAWRTIEAWRKSNFSGLVVLRMLFKEGDHLCRYNLDPSDVEQTLIDWSIYSGFSSAETMVNEAAPDQDVILQGEYLNDPGLCWGYFLHSRSRMHMRDALKHNPVETRGLRSDLILRLAMTPSSYDDWQILLERYPGHVFEVSIYDRCLGDIPNRNALVWGVRKY